ncbi:O-antigen polymerase [Paenibacillus gallinarum]|uniref:Oligosaccharide repeat unit polymerase n=1 Tax=Paenibacillus gallinarum TaxID=2762232 RepID=A0ABR8T485_9BACL|nr:O-antigen polymerase [Paenibacillus gallinarum]MBD7970581.1 oligosaccharide repeat unit polymerase [Paenibacillus gallinarum]
MGIYTISVSLLIILGVPLFELTRKKERRIDFLTLFNILFIIIYGIAPMYLYFFEEYTTWSTIKHTDIHLTSFFLGELIALLFYIIVVISYYFASRLRIIRRAKEFSEKVYGTVSDKQFFRVAMILYLVGGISLILYIKSLGGFDEFIRLGPILRDKGNAVETKWAFLARLHPLLTVASFIFYAFFRTSKEFDRFKYFFFFATALIGAGLSVFHSSGRLNVFSFIITFPLIGIIFHNRIKTKTIVTTLILFLTIILFGDNLLNVNKENDFRVQKNSIEVAGEVIQEFSFPFTNIGNTIMLFPSQYDFRGGIIDIAVAPLNYIPSRIISFEFMERQSVSQFNTTIYNTVGQIPVDMVTFGYMSYGIAGAMIIAILYGFILRFVESIFSYTKSMIASAFFSSIMIFLSFRLMYGDPRQFVYAGFRYVVTFVLLGLLLTFFVRNYQKEKIKTVDRPA